MPHIPKAYFNWSSGKDASLALYKLQQAKEFQVDLLLTSINAHYDRVSMHGLRRELLEQQAKSIGLPLTTIELPQEPTMEVYEQIMKAQVNNLVEQGYQNCGFGDIFLEDLKVYREKQLAPYGVKCHFPLWKKDTKAILEEFIALGFKAVVICVKSELLDESFVGRDLDLNFLQDLPDNVDPCGENGEFHTFCYDGPIFDFPIAFTLGEKEFRSYTAPKSDSNHSNTKDMGFWFQDLIPENEQGSSR